MFSNLAIKPGAKVLELCCGDGFNAKYFYRYRAKEIHSCDFDNTAIIHANTHHKNFKTSFFCADIRYDMLEGKYDNIIWDAAIEYFTPQEIDDIMRNIKYRLGDNGIVYNGPIDLDHY